MVEYLVSSPYFNTETYGNFLDILTYRTIPKEVDDIVYTIKPQHGLRPDLLAYDLYNDSRLWWVFAQRNPNQLKDPYWDFVTGISIYIPKLSMLTEVLGL